MSDLPAIRRETDPAFINRIANSDGVRSFIHPLAQTMDFAPACDAPVTQTGVCFLSNGEDAVAIFALTAPRIWQSHTMFAETCRGRRAVETGRAMVAFMFDRGWADILWGTTPLSNRAARWFNRQIGAVVVGGDEDEEVFEIRRPRKRTSWCSSPLPNRTPTRSTQPQKAAVPANPNSHILSPTKERLTIANRAAAPKQNHGDRITHFSMGDACVATAMSARGREPPPLIQAPPRAC